MYVWIWRHLPGNRWVKSLQTFVLLLAVVALLFLVVFPWVDPRLPWNHVAVGGGSSVAPSAEAGVGG